MKARNKTKEAPFTSPEAAVLQNFVFREKPDIIIDFQGWINCATGDPEIADVFCKYLGLTYEETDPANYDGFFSDWAAKYARAAVCFILPFPGQKT